jgi:HD-like signal output (HDOD) protein
MGGLMKIREYAAMASGNFVALFKKVDIPQLPAAVACLIQEFNKEDPEIERLTEIISSDVELSTKILRTVNSALYGLTNPVKSIHNGIMLLGLKSIRTIALSYTMRASIPNPKKGLFDFEAFWTDSLLQALLAQSLAARNWPKDKDEAFTASLLSHLALPVLLCSWESFYAPIIEQWKESDKRLSEIERADFGWDHAQASAWILKSWDFPAELVGLVGAHNLTIEEIQQHGLEQTVALPIATAALIPSVLRPCMTESKALIDAAIENFSMTRAEFSEMIQALQEKFEDIRELFGLNAGNTGSMLDSIQELCEPQPAEKTSS